MIHWVIPIVTPVANIVFCCYVFLDLKSGDGRTDRRTTCAKTMIPTGRDFGLVEWINNFVICKWFKTTSKRALLKLFKKCTNLLNVYVPFIIKCVFMR